LDKHAKCVPDYCDPVPMTRVRGTWRPAVPNDTDPHTHDSFTCLKNINRVWERNKFGLDQ